MTADAGRRSAAEADYSLVVLDEDGRPYLVLSSEPAPNTGGPPVVPPADGRPAEVPVPAGVAAGTPIPALGDRLGADSSAWDVVVAGGGPAGAVCAIELARWGRRVLLLEAGVPPRYRVGESLSPAACAILRSYDIAFESSVVKPGATFAWGTRAPFATYYADALACQVWRADLDAALLDCARAAGVEVRTGCRVDAVLFADDRATGVRVLAADESTTDERASWVVDATGRDARLAHQRHLIDRDATLDHHAIWAYWRGGRDLPGRAAGNSLYIGGQPAWWYLPVDRRLEMVGVGLIDAGALPAVPPEQRYAAALAEVPILQELLANGRQAGPVRSAQVGAYSVRQLVGPGWLLVGDAAGFVDPVVTPGVQLAVQFGRLAASVVHASLGNPECAGLVAPEYERRVRRKLESFRVLARNLFAAGTRRPPEILLGDLAGGDEQFDRGTFLSTISGLPLDRLQPMLGAYLGMRSASVRYGGFAPVFGEAEGFAFLSWVLGHDRGTPAVRSPAPSMSIATARLGVAEGAVVRTFLLPPTATAGKPRRVRALQNAAGERFLVTRELELLLQVVADAPSQSEAGSRFAVAFGGVPDVEAFGRWVRLLGQHGIVETCAAPRPTDGIENQGAPAAGGAEARVRCDG